MASQVPAPAKKLLDKIGSIEAPRGYGTVYGNNQAKLPKPLTSMTLAEVLSYGPKWAKQFGSSAVGRYQFMAGTNHTLVGLKNELKLSGDLVFDEHLQDILGFHLLRRRGYDKWISGQMTTDAFMINLAKEWASFPVPYDMKGASRNVKRGQSYYAGDGLNKSLVDAGKIWLFLEQVRKEADGDPQPVPVTPPPPLDTEPVPDDIVVSLWQAFRDAFDQWLKNRKA